MVQFVQRWRIVFRRGPAAEPLAHRDLIERWQNALAGSDLPALRLVVAVPLPTGMVAEREVADVWLTERRTSAEVRPAIVDGLPGGLELVELYDVWIGEAALPGRVVGADYRVRLSGRPDPDALAAAASDLLAARALPRERAKGDRVVAYDLRPLLADIGPPRPAGDGTAIDVRVRHVAELGVGRPEEVCAALADRSGEDVRVEEVLRLRILLADDPAEPLAGPV